MALSELKVVPTWVNKYKESGHSGYLYTVYPLEAANDGAAKFGLTGTAATKSAKSYERTKAIVAGGTHTVPAGNRLQYYFSVKELMKNDRRTG